MSRTLLRALLLLLIALGAAGAYGYVLWGRADELVRTQVVAGLQEQFPDWLLDVGRARMDFEGRIHIYDLKLRLRAADPPLAVIPEVIVVADRDQLAQQQLLIHQLRLVRPQLRLVREADGKWNIQKLAPPPPSSGVSPELVIEQGQMSVLFDPAQTDAEWQLREIDVRLVPSGKGGFALQAGGAVAEAGRILVEGDWQLDGGWALAGEVRRIPAGQDLLEMAAAASPEFRVNLQQTLARFDLDARASAADRANLAETPHLGLEARIDVAFRVSQADRNSAQRYKLLVDVSEGTLTHRRLPFPLEQVGGQVYCDQSQLVLKGITARHGATQLHVDGRLRRAAPRPPGEFRVVVKDLVIEESLRPHLPAPVRAPFDVFHPTGVVDLNLDIRSDGQGPWTCLTTLEAKGCSAWYTKFPYLLERITGTVTHRPGLCRVALQGFAGDHAATLGGELHTGPQPHAEFVFQVDDFPMDEKLVAACTPPVQATLKALALAGQADVVLRVARNGGPEAPFTQHLVCQVEKASVNYKSFAYPVSELTGVVECDGTTWTFKNLAGKHGQTTLSGEGVFHQLPNPGLLDLTIQARHARFDGTLQAALPESWQGLWSEFSPSGRFHVENRILWSPGTDPRLRLDVELVEAGCQLKSFPYAIEGLKGKLSMADGRVDLVELEGTHDETQIRADGYAEIDPTGEWRVRIEELAVDDLDPGRQFRRALPEGFREVVENLDPRGGLLSMVGMLELRGTGRPQDHVTAAWDVETIYAGASLTAGVDLHKIHGKVLSRGVWDGETVVSKGTVDFDSVMIRDYQFTQVRGPISINGSQLIIGSKDAVNLTSGTGGGDRITTDERITLRAIDGLFTLDGIAVLDETTSYRVLLTMNGARLEQYADLYLPRHENLQGIMNGWVELSGRGTATARLSGRGQLQISPASLYELPVMVSMFKMMSFVPPDKTAFRSCFVQFDIGGSQFNLRQIDLVGDAINLRGRGYVRFDGKLSLDFFSSAARNQWSLPIVELVVGEATRGWLGVEIRGTTTEPVATVKAVPKLDEALKRFLGALEPRPVPPPILPAERPRGPTRR